MSKKEVRSVNLALNVEKRAKEDDVNVNVITGYGAVFYNGEDNTQFRLWDYMVERISPSAFNDLNEDVRALFNHNPDKVLGRTTANTLNLSVDEKGLKYEIELPNSPLGEDVAESIRRQDITGSSFAFIPESVIWDVEKDENGNEIDVRNIQKLKLIEVSPVTFPAYEGTSVGARNDDIKKELEKIKEERKKECYDYKKDIAYCDAVIKTKDIF